MINKITRKSDKEIIEKIQAIDSTIWQDWDFWTTHNKKDRIAELQWVLGNEPEDNPQV